MGILRRSSLPAAALLCLSLGLGGCSSEPSYCDELSATTASLDTLVNTNIVSEGTDTLQQNYDAFTTQVDALITSAGDEFADETAAVQASLDQVAAVVDEGTQLNLGAVAEQAGPALESLKSSTRALVTSLQTEC